MNNEDVALMMSYVHSLNILQNYTKRCDCSLHQGRIVISVAVRLPNGRPAIIQEEDEGFRVEVGDIQMIGRGDLRKLIPVPYVLLNAESAITYLSMAGL